MDIEHEIAQHHAATLRAIETGRNELAIRRLKAYVNFAEAFLEAASRRGVVFSPDAAGQVSITDWRTPSQIIHNACDGIIAAVRSGNVELIGGASYIPIQFMKMSVEKGDFLFYRKMSQVYAMMLATSYAMDSTSHKEMVIDRSWRCLREFSDYFLPKLMATYDQKTKEHFASELVWRFGDLMKVALDHNDTAAFAVVGKKMNSLFQRHRMEIAGLPSDAGTPLEASVTDQRSIVWFGLGGWILRSFVSRDTPRMPGQPDPRLVTPDLIPTFLGLAVTNFSNIGQLARTYERALSTDQGSPWWQWWLIDTLPEGEAHWIDFGRWLAYFYVVAGLRLSKSGSPTATDIPKPFSDLEFRMGDIRAKVAEVKANGQAWKVLIPSLPIDSATGTTDAGYGDYFLMANEAAVKEWARRREDEIIAASIDQSSVAKFKEDCLKGWQDGSWLVNLMLSLGRHANKKAEAGSYLGYDQLEGKEAFIAPSDSNYLALSGSLLGSNLVS